MLLQDFSHACFSMAIFAFLDKVYFKTGQKWRVYGKFDTAQKHEVFH